MALLPHEARKKGLLAGGTAGVEARRDDATLLESFKTGAKVGGATAGKSLLTDLLLPQVSIGGQLGRRLIAAEESVASPAGAEEAYRGGSELGAGTWRERYEKGSLQEPDGFWESQAMLAPLLGAIPVVGGALAAGVGGKAQEELETAEGDKEEAEKKQAKEDEKAQAEAKKASAKKGRKQTYGGQPQPGTMTSSASGGSQYDQWYGSTYGA